jgi:hypothetical protein
LKNNDLGKIILNFTDKNRAVCFTPSPFTDALPADLVHANESKWLAPHTANDCGM